MQSIATIFTRSEIYLGTPGGGLASTALHSRSSAGFPSLRRRHFPFCMCFLVLLSVCVTSRLFSCFRLCLVLLFRMACDVSCMTLDLKVTRWLKGMGEPC